jgi:ankyrin repeat protein
MRALSSKHLARIPALPHWQEQAPLDAMLMQRVAEAPHEEIEALLSQGASANAIDLKHGTRDSALHAAARRELPGLVQLFIDRGADINHRNSDSRTPLDTALQVEGNHAVIISLLRAGAEITPFARDSLRTRMNAGFHVPTASALVERGEEGLLREAMRLDRASPRTRPLKAFMTAIEARRASAANDRPAAPARPSPYAH